MDFQDFFINQLIEPIDYIETIIQLFIIIILLYGLKRGHGGHLVLFFAPLLIITISFLFFQFYNRFVDIRYNMNVEITKEQKEEIILLSRSNIKNINLLLEKKKDNKYYLYEYKLVKYFYNENLKQLSTEK